MTYQITNQGALQSILHRPVSSGLDNDFTLNLSPGAELRLTY